MKAHHKRHRDDEIIDEITFKTIPRYKSSYLSGDEWRTSVVVELKRKGEVMFSRSYHSMDTASAHLPWLLKTWVEDLRGEDDKRWSDRVDKDKKTCSQPGCPNLSTVTLKLKNQFSREGYKESSSDHYCDVVRTFCASHSTRGDCGLEDADLNYEVVKI